MPVFNRWLFLINNAIFLSFFFFFLILKARTFIVRLIVEILKMNWMLQQPLAWV